MKTRGRLSYFWGFVATCLLLGAAGCDGECYPELGMNCPGEGGSGGAGGGGGGPCTPPEPPKPGPNDTFPEDGRHVIVIDSAGLCTPVGGWHGDRLFKGGIKNKQIGGRMATYCAYVWKDPDASPNFMDLAGLTWMDDPPTITPQTDVDDWAYDKFLAQFTHPRAPVEENALKPRVRVLVLDTEKDTQGGPDGDLGTNRHGELMADLIRALACPPSSTETCTVDLQTWLALPRRLLDGVEKEVTTGGDYGRPSDLAYAVGRALDRWRTEIYGLAMAPQMLVLNLSIGFEKMVSPDQPDDPSADDLIQDALKAFSCHGGVIFAAAGNHGGEGSTGLLYPAAWQDTPQPEEAECKELLGSEFYEALINIYGSEHAVGGVNAALHRTYLDTSGQPTAGKLLHAVGALDAGGIPITKTREQGEVGDACPRYAALGLGWSVSDKTDFLLTGTSVSTAVVSGLFAAAAAQSSFAGEGEPLAFPSLNAHPQAILDRLPGNTDTHRFGVRGPCRKAWVCPGRVPWLGRPTGTVAGTTPQNDAADFPWENYLNNGSLTLTTGAAQDHGCTEPPLCQAPAASAVFPIFPQPIDLPCLKGCFVDINHSDLFINPAMNLTHAMLLIEQNGEKQLFSLGDLFQNTSYTIPIQSEFPIGTRVSISALSSGMAVSEQVLLVNEQ